LPGESSSGDQSLVRRVGNTVLVGVVDALGHGREAAETANRAIAAIERFAHEPLPSIIQRVHADLIGTRGAVLSLASFRPDERAMTWVGVGNVDGLLLFADPGSRPRHAMLVTRAGILGSELPRTSPWVVPVHPGDTLIFSTDGVHPGFSVDTIPSDSPQDLAERILSRHAKDTDDALVMVVRYLGEE
jgi:hypothetical protein